MSVPIKVDTTDVCDPLLYSADRLDRLARTWGHTATMRSAVKWAASLMAEHGITHLAPAAPEATAWAVLVSRQAGGRLVQPGLSSVTEIDVLVLEPVILTGISIARTSAVLRQGGARTVIAAVGEAPYFALDMDQLGVDGIAVFRGNA